MVLWEITLGTAYFLGLKRTYRLALHIQRRLIRPNHPKTRQFVHRRTRAIFNVALQVHKSIQERDIEVGRNLGNWILRWLDRMKPSAHIRGEKPPLGCNVSATMRNRLTNSPHQKTHGGFLTFNGRRGDRESDKNMFTSSRSIWRKPFPTIFMMMPPVNPSGSNTQYRHLSIFGTEAFKFNWEGLGSKGVIRKDIMQWMLQN